MATKKPSLVEVSLWGTKVGVLAEQNNRVLFQYQPDYLHDGVSISPLHLPLTSQPFENVAKRDVFGGLMGVFADSLPDLYGKKIIRNFFQTKYNDPRYMPGPLHTLMYIGSRGIGALEYAPVDQHSIEAVEALELADMVAYAKRVIDGDFDRENDAKSVITSIMQSGSLAGGARPKAVIGWDRSRNSIIAGVPPLPSGYEHWLIKFDGTRGQPEDWGKVEFVYSEIARLCGIEMSETRLIRESGRAHFMTKRFDIDDQGERLHMHSLSGLMHNDFNEQRSMDYSQFFDAVRFVTRDEREVRKAFQRLAYNFVGRNCDDHTKNFSFLMESNGEWRLSPQYDLCYSFGQDRSSWVHQHQMTVLGNDDFTRDDVLAIGKAYDISDAKDILEVTDAAFSQWPRLAAKQGIDGAMIRECEATLMVERKNYVQSAPLPARPQRTSGTDGPSP